MTSFLSLTPVILGTNLSVSLCMSNLLLTGVLSYYICSVSEDHTWEMLADTLPPPIPQFPFRVRYTYRHSQPQHLRTA